MYRLIITFLLPSLFFFWKSVSFKPQDSKEPPTSIRAHSVGILVTKEATYKFHSKRNPVVTNNFQGVEVQLLLTFSPGHRGE